MMMGVWSFIWHFVRHDLFPRIEKEIYTITELKRKEIMYQLPRLRFHWKYHARKAGEPTPAIPK